jgi:hypothetical protein
VYKQGLQGHLCTQLLIDCLGNGAANFLGIAAARVYFLK